MGTVALADRIEEMVRRIVERFHPERVVLFGSHARGTATPDSDVDLLVVMPPGTPQRDTAVAIDLALMGVGLAKEVIVVTTDDVRRSARLPGHIVRSAMEEGRVWGRRAQRLKPRAARHRPAPRIESRTALNGVPSRQLGNADPRTKR